MMLVFLAYITSKGYYIKNMLNVFQNNTLVMFSKTL